jgi:CO/xanthine dehydrogenase Mo-binding subunit
MVISKLIERCCQTIAKRRFRDPLPIEVKRSFRLPKTFRWDERSFSGKPFPYLSWGAAVVEVEVDTLCLKPVLKGIWLALDCGKLYDERTAHKSVIADTLHVLDWISSKTFDYNKHSWTNYTFDQAGTFGPPHIRIDFLSTQKQPGYGGIGDLAANLIPAAFTSAVSQATGYYIDSLPVYPELIYQYMEES